MATTTLGGGRAAGAYAPADPRRWAVLAVLCLALLVVGIDGTIVNVALPTLVREIGASSTELQWIVDAYTIVFAGFLLIAGNTGDRLGRKACLMVGMGIFGAGSLACALVDDATALIVVRGVQGFGAAFIMPATLSILTNVFTNPSERARAISIWAGVSGLGVAIGPLTGGFLLEHFWWGSIFLVNVPIVIVAVIAIIAIVPDSRDPRAPRLDLVGTLLSTVGLIALLYGIIEGPHGWTEPLVIAGFVGAVVLLTAFVWWERRIDYPILDVTFFANPRFTAASIAVTLVFFAMFGSMFFISQYLQFVMGLSAFESGLRLVPVAAVLMVAAPTSAKLVARYGTKLVVAGGLLLVAGALLLFSLVDVDTGYGLVALVLVLVGAGMGLAMAPATDSIMGSLPAEKAGVGSAMNDTTREVGGALGVAILGSISASVYSSEITGRPEFAQLEAASPALASAVEDSVGSAAIAATQLPGDLGRQLVAIANQAFVDGLDRTVVVGAIAAALGAVVALLWLPARATSGRSEAAVQDLVEGAALRVIGPDQRRSLARITLDMLAEAGMSSLTYHGVAARSGVATATLERNWTSRVDAVTDAIAEMSSSFPIPDTGDLEADLRAYLTAAGAALADPHNREVLSALQAEAATDPDLATALRERVIGPRRAELFHRLEGERDRLRVTPPVALDLLLGPVLYRVTQSEARIDEVFVDAVVSSVVLDEPR